MKLSPTLCGITILAFAFAFIPAVRTQTETENNDIPNNQTTLPQNLPPIPRPDPSKFSTAGGTWEVIGKSGIPAVHLALLSPTKMMIINRVDTPSSFLPGGTSPFTSLYDLTTNQFDLIPFLRGQPGCATGVFLTNGTLVTTGGKIGGQAGAGEWVRSFTYNTTLGLYNRWYESFSTFTSYRWYSSAALMPDGTVLFVGGSLNATIVYNNTNPTYEFLPNKNPNNQPTPFPFLVQNAPWVLYPAVHVVPDGNVFIFVNQAAQIWDPYTNTVIKPLPNIPGSPRTYPLTGNTIMLPLKSQDGWAPEFMVCGGSVSLSKVSTADPTCGRIRPYDNNPQWAMETMPYSRLMPDSLVLPTGDILLINGAQTGFAGYGVTSTLADIHARDPVLNPVLYNPLAPAGSRFTILPATTIPRMYHSTAYLLPDGRVFVAGSSSNDPICVTESPTCTYPTMFDIEAFSPPYMLLNDSQPVITPPSLPLYVDYGKKYQVIVSGLSDFSNMTARLINTGFTTHSSHFDQRTVNLDIEIPPKDSNSSYLTFTTPPNSSVVPPSPMFYLYVVSSAGKPSTGVQVSFNPNPPAAPIPNPSFPVTTSSATNTQISLLISLVGMMVALVAANSS